MEETEEELRVVEEESGKHNREAGKGPLCELVVPRLLAVLHYLFKDVLRGSEEQRYVEKGLQRGSRLTRV